MASVHEPHCALNLGTRIGTVGLERSHAATGEQGAGDFRPMIATGIFINDWRPAEFSPYDH